MVDAIRGVLSPDASPEELMRAALFEAPSVARTVRVSEAIPIYTARSSSPSSDESSGVLH